MSNILLPEGGRKFKFCSVLLWDENRQLGMSNGGTGSYMANTKVSCYKASTRVEKALIPYLLFVRIIVTTMENMGLQNLSYRTVISKAKEV